MYPSITGVRDIAALQSFSRPNFNQIASVYEECANEIDNHLLPLSHPRNTFFRYTLAEPDPFAEPVWDAEEHRMMFPPPGCLYRPVSTETVLLAIHDSAIQLKIGADRLTVTGDKGYATARATHSVFNGRWYFEIEVKEMPEGSAARIGWSQLYSDLEAPIGFNKFGYSWRSLKGSRFHNGYCKTYGQGYTVGDILGFFIELPESKNKKFRLESFKNQCLISNEGYFYYEKAHSTKEALESLTQLAGSTIEFFKNGYSEGVAFTEIFEGAYYPSISLFKNAKVKINFGPKFKYDNILEDYEARAYSERAQDYAVELYVANMVDLIVNCENIPSLRIMDKI